LAGRFQRFDSTFLLARGPSGRAALPGRGDNPGHFQKGVRKRALLNLLRTPQNRGGEKEGCMKTGMTRFLGGRFGATIN
jgi:hypothetical protein